ncbi:hypothetical protein SDC9_182474 [bioreactor metagenome]|uniref:Uncharacterized protein n=1 Tax=bioreactor metagenome TaxID=1076179 RepID=A0A645H8F7_9ZZZZ
MRSIAADNRGCLGKAVALENRDADGSKETLLLCFQQCSTAYTVEHLIPEYLTKFGKDQQVCQGIRQPCLDADPSATLVKAIAVSQHACLQAPVENTLDERTLLVNPLNHFLHEVARDGRDGHQEHRIQLHKVFGEIADDCGIGTP